MNRLVFPVTIGIGYENIPRNLNTRLSRVEIRLMKVNKELPNQLEETFEFGI